MISIGKCKALARKHLLGNYTLVIGARLLSLIIPVALFVLAAASLAFAVYGGDLAVTFGLSGAASVTIGSLLFSAFLILAVLTSIFCGYGVTKLYINICRRDSYGLSDIFYPFTLGAHPWRVVGVKLVMGLIFAVASLLVIIVYRFTGYIVSAAQSDTAGTICQVLAAVVVLVYLYIFITFYLTDLIIIDKPGTGVFEAFDMSARIMKGHKLKGFWFIFISFLFWRFLTSVCSLAVLWVAPYMACSRIFFYISAEGTLYDDAVLSPSGSEASQGPGAEYGLTVSGETEQAVKEKTEDMSSFTARVPDEEDGTSLDDAALVESSKEESGGPLDDA